MIIMKFYFHHAHSLSTVKYSNVFCWILYSCFNIFIFNRQLWHKRGEKTQDLTSLCNPVKQMNLICLKFLLFYLLWVCQLLLSISYTCILMLNSWMFIHHTVKKQINLWTKMFLNNKSYFSVDTKSIYLFVHVLFELVCILYK